MHTILPSEIKQAHAHAVQSASWVIRERATKRVICETFNARVIGHLKAEYEAVPIIAYLGELNRAISAA